LLANDATVRNAAAAEDLIAAPLATFILRALDPNSDWCIDPVNASRMLLMDADRLEWSGELLRHFGLDRSLLPVIVPSRTRYGELMVGGKTVPLCVLGGDQSAALFCAGEPAQGAAFVNVGTGAFIQTVVGATRPRHPDLLASVVWADERRLYVLEGTVNGAGSALAEQSAALGREAPDYAELDRMLARSARRGLFLNGVSGLGSPDWIPDFQSCYIDAADAEDKLAAVIDSIVFLVLRNLDAMRDRITIDRIVLTGGLSRLDWIGQQLACLGELPVQRLDDPEATARGLAYLVSAGTMQPPTAAGTIFTPKPSAAMRRRHAMWRTAMREALAAARFE
jgi:glycerol kinase